MENTLKINLENLPAYNALQKGLSERLKADNAYVRDFIPEADGYYDEKGDDGRQICIPVHLNERRQEDEAIEALLDDNSGSFEDFVHDALRADVTEFIRAIIKECRKCGHC